jgi:hypothetical protein
MPGFFKILQYEQQFNHFSKTVNPGASFQQDRRMGHPKSRQPDCINIGVCDHHPLADFRADVSFF